MDTVVSYTTSVGIIAFGVWMVAGTIAAGSPLADGTTSVLVGSISLYQATRLSPNRVAAYWKPRLTVARLFQAQDDLPAGAWRALMGNGTALPEHPDRPQPSEN